MLCQSIKNALSEHQTEFNLNTAASGASVTCFTAFLNFLSSAIVESLFDSTLFVQGSLLNNLYKLQLCRIIAKLLQLEIPSLATASQRSYLVVCSDINLGVDDDTIKEASICKTSFIK